MNIVNMVDSSTEDNQGFVGKYFTYPNEEGKRIKEGGLRLAGKRKYARPDSPLVTVITVCLNSDRTIEQTIQSVIKQTYENIEYLIIDGGSTDSTVDILLKYAQQIDYYLSEPDEGLYYAMNKGLELASGDYILILNSDDWYEDDCVESLVVGLRASHADISSGLTRLVREDGTAIRVLDKMPYNSSCRFGMSIRHELMLVSRAIYNRLGSYNTKYKIIADWDFSVRCYNAGLTHYEIARPLLNFRVSGVSSTQWENIVKEHHVFLAAQYPEIPKGTLRQLSDLRSIKKETIDKALIENRQKNRFCKDLIAYGYRREFYDDKKTPSIVVPKDPCISVIVPVYNAADSLDRCLETILSQDGPGFEIICINDGSQDRSLDLLKKLAVRDDRIRIINHKKNLGVAAARNRGIKEARGEYIFFVDADDELERNCLTELANIADRYHADMVRGTMEKVLISSGRRVLAYQPPNNQPVFRTNPKKTPELIATFEGFTTYLYRTNVARNALFDEDLVVGEDCLFLLKCLFFSTYICWTTVLTYRYLQNPQSAMARFSLPKYLSAIAWRERAWTLLSGQQHTERARFFAHRYWNPQLIADADSSLSSEEAVTLKHHLCKMLQKTGFEPETIRADDQVGQLLSGICQGVKPELQEMTLKATMTKEKVLDKEKPLRVGVFNTFDRGGAAIGSIRRIQALRDAGIEATLHPLVSKSKYSFVQPLATGASQDKCWQAVHRESIVPAQNVPGFSAEELFSLPFSILDYRQYQRLINSLDIIHLHWVVGILDYTHAGQVFGSKPVVWTLADMNAFTGGCHYSQGCTRYEQECECCPLLGGSDLAWKAHEKKREAYARIKNLTIICPSRWVAEKARNSTLLKNRRIVVIPNAFPVHEFPLTPKIVARIRLGLPLNKKLVLFGADSLKNKRKGGDRFIDAMNMLPKDEVQAVTFGSGDIHLERHKINHLGFLDGNQQIALAYAACDVYAFPSREDNAPLTVSEALLSGTPVVAFPVGNVLDIVRHRETGYIVEEGNIADFAAGLLWAIQYNRSPLQSRLGIKCRQSASDYHSPSLSAERHINLYQEALSFHV